MRTLYILALFSLFFLKSYSQLASDPVYSRFSANSFNEKNYLTIGSSILSSPTSVLSWYKQFLLLQFTEKEMTDKLISSLKDENHLGTCLKNDVYFATSSGRKFSFGIGLKNTAFQHLDASRDAIKLFLLGNSSFEGKTANFSSLRFMAYAYQEVYLTASTKKQTSFADVYFGLNLGYINGAMLNDLNIERGSLFTAINGDSIFADISFSLQQNNPDKKELWQNNGNGFSSGAFIFFKFNNKDELYFSLNDFGAINWSNKTVNLTYDTSISFTGADILTENPFSSLKNGLFDTIANYPENALRSPYKTALPYRISMVYKINQLSDKFGITAGFTYTHLKYLSPHLFLNADFKVSKFLILKPGISLDSYQNPGFNLELELNPFKNVKFVLGSFHLENPIVTKMNGQSWYFGLATAF